MVSDATKDAIRSALSDPRKVAQLLNLDTKGADRREKRQARGGVWVLCPWHSEKHPSCSLTCPDGTLRAVCFTCGGRGDVFSLLAAVRGLDGARDFPAVLREAGELAGVDVSREEHQEGREARRKEPPAPLFAPIFPPPIGPGDQAFGALVAPLLHLGALDGGPLSRDVCAYLESRRLLDVARAEGWTALPPAGSDTARSWCRMLRDIAAELEIDAVDVAAELAAIVREDGEGFRHEAHRLVIPFRAPDGTVYTWQRRALDGREPKYVFPRSRDAADGPDAREGRGRSARWPHGSERLATAPLDAPIVYTEGALDAGAVRAIDAAKGRVRVVLGVPGTQAWKRGEGFFATFARGRATFVATDMDAPKDGREPAGESAAKVWGADLWRAGALDVQRIRPPAPAKDWSEALAAAELTQTGNRT